MQGVVDPVAMAQQGGGAIPTNEILTIVKRLWEAGGWFAVMTQTSIYLLIPLFLAILSSNHRRIQQYCTRSWSKFRKEHVRDINYTASSDYYAQLRQDNRNNILQKSIMLYFAKRRNEKYHDGLLQLMRVETGNENWDDRRSVSRTAEQLRKFEITVMPAHDVFEEIEPGLFFSHSETTEDKLGDVSIHYAYQFKTYRKEGDKFINDFISKCYQEYIDVLRKQEDKARYMYVMQLGMKPAKTEDGGGGSSAPPVFKKYKLSDEKTFDCLYFKEKNNVVNLIDDFVEKREKFAIEGFPQKLGILLHGPPGTGKTSFVKALATYTSRHIVSVPLGKISTNQELYDIMFERVFPCLGDDGVAQQMKFDEVIFLMEEIDAATDIVKTRKTPHSQESTMQRAATILLERESQAESPAAAAGGADQSPPKLQVEGISTVASAGGFDAMTDLTGENVAAGGALGLASLLPPVADKLDLAGLLNILDGVVDSPGRIVVMTTNHPEKLDPALIRPGRINSQLFLGFMEPDDLIGMVAHHFGELSQKQQKEIRTILNDKARVSDTGSFDISPAEVEQLCVEFDTAEEFMVGLQRFPDLGQAFDYNN